VTPERQAALLALCQRLRHGFSDLPLLDRALTHASRVNEDTWSGLRHNEPLEFLGDAVVGLCVTGLLHEADPDGDEGGKSRARAAMVSAKSLARRAEALGLPDLLTLGRGEEKTGGRKKRALWANAYEAVMAALYLDGGLPAAEAFLRREFEQEARSGIHLARADHKTALQEVLQARGEPPPCYELLAEEGQSHSPRFRVACVVGGVAVAEGEGSSKKEAQQAAAARALELDARRP
jgi:ribonuclease-3